ncbi:MAG: cytochrome c oxidase subunit II, partial [Gammaproteobacteria bacterium]|nr:cytochrome c oxidase subunit II [Gammaproteobacteria bacterium]
MKQKYLVRSINSLLALAVIASQNVWAEIQPYNMTEGVTDISKQVFDLHMVIFYICCVIG